MDWLLYENKALSAGYEVICGVDEAGRGSLAGPVYAAAVILPKGYIIEGVDDSKKLTPKKREILYDKIIRECDYWAIGTADEKEIDKLNILQATLLAMKRAVNALPIVPGIALVDGNQCPALDNNISVETIVHGDANSASIAAASILAKVSRDRYMIELSKKYPEYKFDIHKGYGTKLHYQMIEKYGVSDVHRKTFLKKVLDK